MDLCLLMEEYDSIGLHFHSARVGTLLAKEYLDERRFSEAERVSRTSVARFEALGDTYGAQLARAKLAAALSGIPAKQPEAIEITHRLQQQLDPDDYPRLRAVICNIITRHYRDSGQLSIASEHAREAIEIGQTLHDFSVIAINRANLGNVLRDAGCIDDAIQQYELSAQAAVSGSIVDAEAFASQLIASTLNERREYTLAEHHARYASARASQVANQHLIARAEAEVAVALAGKQEIAEAVQAYVVAAEAAISCADGSSLLLSVVTDALALCTKHERADLKLLFVRDALLRDRGLAPELEEDVRVFFDGFVRLVQIAEDSWLMPIVSLTMVDVLDGLPEAVERRVVLQGIKSLIAAERDGLSRTAMSAVVGLLVTQSGNCLTLADIVGLSEEIARKSHRLYFKPQASCGAHWTMRLDIDAGVVLTITQLDESLSSAVLSMAIVLSLASFHDLIGGTLFGSSRVGRKEVMVHICQKDYLEREVGAEILRIGDMELGFAVMESADVTLSDQPPVTVIWGDGFWMPWHPMEQSMSRVQIVLGRVLGAISVQILAKEVEREVLSPKILDLVRGVWRGR